MKRTLITALLAALALAAQAADIIVPAGGITVPEAAVTDVKAWLATEELAHIKSIPVVVSATNELGEVEVVSSTSRKVRVVTPETPQQKLRRIYRAAGDAAIRAGLRQFRQARADKAAQAEMDAMADPVAEEE